MSLASYRVEGSRWVFPPESFHGFSKSGIEIDCDNGEYYNFKHDDIAFVIFTYTHNCFVKKISVLFQTKSGKQKLFSQSLKRGKGISFMDLLKNALINNLQQHQVTTHFIYRASFFSKEKQVDPVMFVSLWAAKRL